MSIGRLSIGETQKEVVNRSIIELQERIDGEGRSAFRPPLSADRTYYVRTDGSDSNTGLFNTAAGAFLTIQKAIDVSLPFDLNNFAITIQVAAGTYTGTVTVSQPFIGGTVTIIGDTTTPANVLISTTGNAITVQNGARLSLAGLKITSSAASCIYVFNNGIVTIAGKMEYGTASFAHVYVEGQSGFVNLGFTFLISGGATYHWIVITNSLLTVSNSVAVLTGTPGFAQFVLAAVVSSVRAASISWSGAATGTRFFAIGNAAISVFGGGVNYFPGNSPGLVDSGGQYL